MAHRSSGTMGLDKQIHTPGVIQSMSQYHHLTIDEREKILSLQSQGKSLSQIAQVIGRARSTITRELNRNSLGGEYFPHAAQTAYEKRREHCHRHNLLEDPKLFNFVKYAFLEEQWSPVEIAGRLKLERSKSKISYATIYRAIYAGWFDTPEERRSYGCKGAVRKLRHHGKSRHTKSYEEKRGKIRISHKLTERPKEAEERSRIGDWEADTVAGKTGGPCLLTLVDRKSLFTKAVKIPKKTAAYVKEGMIACLKDAPCYTITPDRGKEFARHEEISEALNGVPFYFPEPHQPWQRGRNENTNGLLREYYPRGTDLTLVDQNDVQIKVEKLNKRPRESLGFLTPYEVFYSVVLHLT